MTLERRGTELVWILSFLGSVLVVSSIIVLVAWVVRGNRATLFDAEEWKSWSVSTKAYAIENPRREMVQNLLDSKINIGMSSSDVVVLLGAPDESTPTELSYYLGGGGGFILPSYDFLRLKLDASDTVIDISVEAID